MPDGRELFFVLHAECSVSLLLWKFVCSFSIYRSLTFASAVRTEKKELGILESKAHMTASPLKPFGEALKASSAVASCV